MRARVSAATSVRPLRTLDTAETDTPASAAMPARVLRRVPGATAAPFRNFHRTAGGERRRTKCPMLGESRSVIQNRLSNPDPQGPGERSVQVRPTVTTEGSLNNANFE